ncbi:MAG: hypothetical protein NTZ05_02075 [Chloroflexi bacterium]|nr:hypothetical protein [Chloroflexota bacterium]
MEHEENRGVVMTISHLLLPLLRNSLVVAIFMATISGCSSVSQPSTDQPEATAKQSFTAWATKSSTPYKDISSKVVKSDGTFATVRINVNLRPQADVDWAEYSADIPCRNVGGQWQCESSFTPSKTEAQVAKEDAKRSMEAEAARTEAKEAAKEKARIGWSTVKITDVGSWDCQMPGSQRYCAVNVTIRNDDSKGHSAGLGGGAMPSIIREFSIEPHSSKTVRFSDNRVEVTDPLPFIIQIDGISSFEAKK